MFGSKLMDVNVAVKTALFCVYEHAAILRGGTRGEGSSRPTLSAVISQLSARRIKLISSADVTTAVRLALASAAQLNYKRLSDAD